MTANMTIAIDPPLAGIHVVDAVTGPLAPISRYLADLGARVDRLDDSADNNAEDVADNSGKYPHDYSLGSSDAKQLVSDAHMIVADASHAGILQSARRDNPALITMATSDFGTGNSLSDWQGSGAVLHALSGELSRSGIRGREPLMPPENLAYQCAAVQASFALLAALYRALRTGRGAHFDFSALDGAVQALDPGFGISGSATLGKPVGLLSRDRPRAGFQYPIFPCADGFVRICLLAKRQWRGMFEWMGSPEQFASPQFNSTMNRYKSPELLPYIGKFFKDRNRGDLEREGQAHGVPIAALLTLPEFLESDHLKARGALRDHAVAQGENVVLPRGIQTIDGERSDFSHVMDMDTPYPELVPELAENMTEPFAGIKVLDLGVIVVGAEQARLLGDLGADVIKVESQAFPDGNRQSYLDFGMSVSFAAGHRNKRSLGINLRSDKGRELFLDMVREADVVCSNFKPGTMEKLGLGREILTKLNPKIIVSESSAFGDSGPWSGRMGYGPLVRASTGMTLNWRYPDAPHSFSDTTTIYPDHVAGRVCAMGVVALLIRRVRTDQGGVGSVAQSEVMLSHFAADISRISGEDYVPLGQPVKKVYQAAGDDEWCVVDAQGSAERQALAQVVGAEEDTDLEALLEKWLAVRSPEEAALILQAAGIPSAPMLRIAELPEHRYYRDRAFYRVDSHPWLKEKIFAENYIVKSDDFPLSPNGPAPLVGENTEDVIAEWLDIPKDEIAQLCADKVLEPLEPRILQSAKKYMAAAD